MDMVLFAVVGVVLLALLFDFTNGFHDAANATSTVVATRAMTPKHAVYMSAFFNFSALFIVGTAVANTVAKAYAELVRDGVLESRHGRGVFVGKRRCVFSASERRRRLENALNVFLSEALTLDFNPQQIQEEVAKRLEQMTAKE